MEPTKSKSNGAVWGSIIIIVILIAGGIYIWSMHKSKTAQPAAAPENTSSLNANSADQIDAEMNSTDMDNLDQGL